jgi:probable HAF family extracellular repeat protein
MKSGTSTCVILLAALLMPLQLFAQNTRYKLIDIGTLGGPASYFTDPGVGPQTYVLNDRGMLAGKATLPIPDPHSGNCPPICFQAHVFRWYRGFLTDLGTLPGGNDSDVGGINARGWIAGGSETAALSNHAVLWEGTQIIDLGTLGTGENSVAVHVNNSGQVVGLSTIDTSNDPCGFAGGSLHPFVWQNGIMRDVGTLPGGPDAFPGDQCGNERNSLVAGLSLINKVVNPNTGMPTVHAFLWDNGTMVDVGTLGGTVVESDPGPCPNNRGQVAGTSSLPGDNTEHAFLWEHGVMRDLGTLNGGTFSQMWWLNDAGDVVGGSTLANDQLFHATLWRNGEIEDLGTVGDDCFSVALGINESNQIVGGSVSCDGTVGRAVVWNQGQVVDLNTVVPENATLRLVDGRNINERGEISGRGLPPGCDDLDACGHDFLLIPCANGSCADPNREEEPVNPSLGRNNTAVYGKLHAPASIQAWRKRYSGLIRRPNIPPFNSGKLY